MKIGFYFERFVIIVTNYHRDYGIQKKNVEFTDSFSFGILMIFIQGIIIALTSLAIFEIIKKKKIQTKSVVNGL